MAKRPQQPEVIHIGGILKKVLQSCRPESIDRLTEITLCWEKAVGKLIAGHARPAALKGPILLVHVSSSSFMQHLTYMKQDLIQHLNQSLQSEPIDDIIFKIGTV